ncbi:MAG: hypothetical protein LQ340_000043 [Diploschistes diacapsis]|nr:MAG: hypothetical protein LQ340_000043 [Diploschistes diacapsis]
MPSQVSLASQEGRRDMMTGAMESGKKGEKKGAIAALTVMRKKTPSKHPILNALLTALIVATIRRRITRNVTDTGPVPRVGAQTVIGNQTEQKRSRSQEYSVDPTPTTPYAHELTDDYDGHNSRKRRDRDYGQEDERERHERKRSRRGHSPNYETVSDRHSRSHESSKPQTPITPSFHGPSSASRRGSMAINGTSQVQVPVLAKPIPTGPRASMQQSRPVERAKEREREAPKAPANKAEKDVHTLEREARDRERLQREMQRRAFGAPKRKGDGTKQPSRRVSYKYEDEDGLDARRVEQEREAGRWR